MNFPAWTTENLYISTVHVIFAISYGIDPSPCKGAASATGKISRQFDRPRISLYKVIMRCSLETGGDSRIARITIRTSPFNGLNHVESTIPIVRESKLTEASTMSGISLELHMHRLTGTEYGHWCSRWLTFCT